MYGVKHSTVVPIDGLEGEGHAGRPETESQSPCISEMYASLLL